MKINDVKLTTLTGTYSGPVYPPGNRQSQALDIYPEFNSRTPAQGHGNKNTISEIYLEILTDEGITGIFGPIESPQAFVVHEFLRDFLIGRDPLATEKLHDQMLRMHRHGRSGLFMTGVSAVDCALWDLKGKAWNQPVYRLLGGPVRPSVPAYASMLGYSIDPAEAVKTALEFQSKGFSAQKWFFRYGPGDGLKGMEENINLVASLREALGSLYPLMFDAYWGWDARYTREILRHISPYKITWLEEPIQPERVGSFAALKRAEPASPLATGEHVYTRWQVKELLVNGAVDFIQTDPDWTGGITELVKICSLCSAFDVPVVAHGHSLLAALHTAGAQSAAVVPYVEYLFRHQSRKQWFHKPAYEPVNGDLALPTLPGLGIVLDTDKIESSADWTLGTK